MDVVEAYVEVKPCDASVEDKNGVVNPGLLAAAACYDSPREAAKLVETVQK